MTSIRFLEFLLLLFLHHRVYSEKVEPVFRAKGTAVEMGYCFGGDYIVVYRCTLAGDQLLGNSSSDNAPVLPPADLRGRVSINRGQHLLGLQISHLTQEDSGIYRRECWQNQTVSKHMQQLIVCDEELETVEIAVKEDGGAMLLCNNTAIGVEGTFVRWYYEMHPLYHPTLFLDSSVSMDPLVKELQGVVKVRNKGAMLLLDNSALKNYPHFLCLVSEGRICFSFQTMHLPDNSENTDIFASRGERVVLKCPSDGNQHWETPQGRFNSTSMKMHIQHGDKSEDFSLVIPEVSDEHSGDYSCISPSAEVQYFLFLCPRKEAKKKVVAEGGSVLLHCDAGEHDSQRVLWERQEPSGEYELILDSKDKSVPIPEDLRGRLSENGSSLTISHLKAEEGGVYRCVVLGGTELMEGGDDYKDDDGEEYAGEDDYNDLNDDLFWEDTLRCIFKQDTTLNVVLSVVKKEGGFLQDLDLENVIGEPGSTDDPSAAPNVTVYAVTAGLVGLVLVVGVIVAVIMIKRRAKASPKQGDIKMNEEPTCTDRLNPNDRDGA